MSLDTVMRHIYNLIMDQYIWDLENIKTGLENFYNAHGRYPTSREVDCYPDLPSSRQIQRRFGGLVELRKVLNLSGPQDFTKGSYSSERARSINKRAHNLEKSIYDFLVTKFGKPFVHREYLFTDDHRARTDFFIHTKDGNFSVDVFFPKDRSNLINCLNSKMKTYGNTLMLQYPVIFLMMNDEISEEEMTAAANNKKNKLLEYQQIMNFNQLKLFCANKCPYSAT